MERPTLEESLYKSCIIPDLIPVSLLSNLTVGLSIKFPTGKRVANGNEVTPGEAAYEPQIALHGTASMAPAINVMHKYPEHAICGMKNMSASYTLILTDEV
jgi:hypothetical protein